MKFLSILFIFSSLVSRAEIMSERFMISGQHEKEKITLREHKVDSGTGYSLAKVHSSGKITGHTISAKKYKELSAEMDQLLKLAKMQKTRQIASCDELVLLGEKAFTKRLELNGICLSTEKRKVRKNFARWWRKASKYL